MPIATIPYTDRRHGRPPQPTRPFTDAVWSEAPKHRRLVASIACRLITGAYNCTADDLINDGMIGLCRAVELYDPSQGIAFSTYATWAVKRHMQRAIVRGYKKIHTTTHIDHFVKRVLYFGLDPATLPSERRRCVEQALQVSTATFLTDTTAIGQHVLRAVADRPHADELAESEWRESLLLAMGGLSPHQRAVLRMYFGLDGPKMTLAEIGDVYEMSGSRIQQIKEQALVVLRIKLNASD